MLNQTNFSNYDLNSIQLLINCGLEFAKQKTLLMLRNEVFPFYLLSLLAVYYLFKINLKNLEDTFVNENDAFIRQNKFNYEQVLKKVNELEKNLLLLKSYEKELSDINEKVQNKLDKKMSEYENLISDITNCIAQQKNSTMVANFCEKYNIKNPVVKETKKRKQGVKISELPIRKQPKRNVLPSTFVFSEDEKTDNDSDFLP